MQQGLGNARHRRGYLVIAVGAIAKFAIDDFDDVRQGGYGAHVYGVIWYRRRRAGLVERSRELSLRRSALS